MIPAIAALICGLTVGAFLAVSILLTPFRIWLAISAGGSTAIGYALNTFLLKAGCGVILWQLHRAAVHFDVTGWFWYPCAIFGTAFVKHAYRDMVHYEMVRQLTNLGLDTGTAVRLADLKLNKVEQSMLAEKDPAFQRLVEQQMANGLSREHAEMMVYALQVVQEKEDEEAFIFARTIDRLKEHHPEMFAHKRAQTPDAFSENTMAERYGPKPPT